MTYAVKEIFLSLQGEGAQTGRPAVFCRFAGCNLWSGLERDRATAQCTFCDTDFVGTDGQNGGKFSTAEVLADAIAALWQSDTNKKAYVIFTGGEPCLQLDSDLLQAVSARGFETAIETNGTLPVPEEVDWICVSPKPNSVLVQTQGQELKFIYPQTDFAPAQFEGLDFAHFFLQPLDASDEVQTHKHTQAAIAYCLAHPQWRLSLQTHKILNLD
ncbi:MAG: 7-carboxy-7-deazaguanine synthase [Alphaproteobacteria bacterium]|nr:7-carboxy-7-deazaguanine synthase [Alphaproteobacteria bacterium]